VELPQHALHLALPGFPNEIEPWDENGEKRGRLKSLSGSHCNALLRADFSRQWRRLDLPVDYSAPSPAVHRRRTTCPTTRIFPESRWLEAGGRFEKKQTARDSNPVLDDRYRSLKLS